MYKIFKAIVVIIWILDICNISVSGISWLSFLEPILNDANGLNTLFWLLVWCLLPTSSMVISGRKED